MKTADTNFPYTLQFPNAWIDSGLISLLTGEETKVLLALARKIFGYQEKRVTMQDRIGRSQFMNMTGLAKQTIDNAIKTFVTCGIIHTGRANRKGRLYSMKPDAKIDLMPLIARRENRKKIDQKRLKKDNSRPISKADKISRGLSQRPTLNNMNLGEGVENLAAFEIGTQNQNDKRKERLNVYKQKPNVVSFSIFENLRESKDKIETCIEIYKLAEKGSEISNVATTLWTVFEFLKETGAGDDIDRSWEAHLKYVRRYSDSQIQKVVSEIRADIRQGKSFRNIPAIYTNKLKNIYLEPKRGMAKAEPAKQQIRKVV